MRNIAGKFANGDEVIVDGFLGMVIRNPSRDTLAFYREKISRKDELYSILQKESSRAAETTDGYRVKLRANIEGADDLEAVSRFGAMVNFGAGAAFGSSTFGVARTASAFFS